jgi:hypothetical protein
MTQGENMPPELDDGRERSVLGRMATRFDDSFVQDMLRIDALTSKVFGGAADAWRMTLRQGMKAEGILVRAFYVILGLIEYALLFLYYAFAFFSTAGGYDLPYGDFQNEQNDERP